MMNTHNDHTPVLSEEILEALTPLNPKNILDGTFGAGSLSKQILQKTNAHIFTLDCDPDAITRAKKLALENKNRLTVLHAQFSHIQNTLNHHACPKLDAAIFDCGVSSPQLDSTERGFSFSKDGPLDMRMSQTGMSARELVNTYPEQEIASILRNFGEEKKASYIARAIVSKREKKLFDTTLSLAKVIESIVPKRGKAHPATKSFQALRIAINNEFNEIKCAIDQTLPFIQDNGLLIIITFHSLEHKVAKKTLEKYTIAHSSTSRYMPEMPQPPYPYPFCLEGLRKCIKPSPQEVLENPRARSAQMRICIKKRA